jgi:hypothetical protein
VGSVRMLCMKGMVGTSRMLCIRDNDEHDVQSKIKAK